MSRPILDLTTEKGKSSAICKECDMKMKYSGNTEGRPLMKALEVSKAEVICLANMQ